MGRIQITAVNHYDVFPFNHGGSLGIRGLYKALSEWVDVNIITFISADVYPGEVKISDHVTVIPIVLPAELNKRQEDFYKKYNMGKSTMVDSSPFVMEEYHKDPYIIERVREIAKDSLIVITEHVFAWEIVKTACPDKHLWYRSNNVEFDYKTTTYKILNSPRDLLNKIFDFEKRCCEQCEKVLTVSQIEADRFMDLYSFPSEMNDRFMDIKSGFDTDSISMLKPSDREKISNEFETFGVYIASNTPNALDAARICIDIAKHYPETRIYLVGRIKEMLIEEKDIPSNIEITGVVTDEEKDFLLSHGDYALNLMEGGAGINVKMFEYFAYGIPVITTEYGARGINMKNQVDGVITDKNNYLNDMDTFFNSSIEEKDLLAIHARELLEKEYSWRSLGKRIIQEIDRMYGCRLEEDAVGLPEIELYDFSPKPSVLPEGDFYIRCAGNNGVLFLKYCRSLGKEPLAFVETAKSKIGTEIKGVHVISEEDFLRVRKSEDVVVAVWSWYEVAADLIANGIKEENIYIAWADNGKSIFRFSDYEGATRPYFDIKKQKRDVLRIAETYVEKRNRV